MYSVTITNKMDGRSVTRDLDNIRDDSTGYEYGNAVAEAISDNLEACIPSIIEVRNGNGTVIHAMAIVPRSGTMMVAEKGAGTMELRHSFKTAPDPIPEKYLVMVNPDKNNNKFYRMTDIGGGKWEAHYGRIGETRQNSYVYPDYMYAIKMKEKLLKGYKDKTECHTATPVQRKIREFADIKDPKVAGLIRDLMKYAQKTIRENYTVKDTDVTQAMVDEAKAEISAMKMTGTVKEFNDHLLELMHIIPRRIDGHGSFGVASMMAKRTTQFQKIIDREENLLDIMEGQVKINAKRSAGNEIDNGDILKAMGIEVYTATKEQEESVRSILNDSLKPKLRQVYRVINKRSQEAFNRYLDEEKKRTHHKPKIKQLWHGSRNANWISILQNSLILNPDAIITGKMFGNGIYFAPSAAKSWGYTSSHDARWTNENSGSAYMAVFATAYGHPYEVFSYTGNWSGYNYKRLKAEHPECSCVHAKKDKGMLHEDEIIFYREDQIAINYICEFAA